MNKADDNCRFQYTGPPSKHEDPGADLGGVTTGTGHSPGAAITPILVKTFRDRTPKALHLQLGNPLSRLPPPPTPPDKCQDQP